MTDNRNEIEEPVYLTYAQRAVIPGTEEVEETKFLYFSDNGTKSFKKTFKFLHSGVKVPLEFSAKDGSSAGQEFCHLFIPDGTLYHAVSYTGDYEGMEKEIKYCAHLAGLTLGWVKDDSFFLEDGRSFLLTDCKIEFYL